MYLLKWFVLVEEIGAVRELQNIWNIFFMIFDVAYNFILCEIFRNKMVFSNSGINKETTCARFKTWCLSSCCVYVFMLCVYHQFRILLLIRKSEQKCTESMKFSVPCWGCKKMVTFQLLARTECSKKHIFPVSDEDTSSLWPAITNVYVCSTYNYTHSPFGIQVFFFLPMYGTLIWNSKCHNLQNEHFPCI